MELPLLSIKRGPASWVLTAAASVGIALASASPASAQAFNPLVTKLHARSTAPTASNFFSGALSLSDRYLVAGDEGNDDAGNNAGTAHLYDIWTGRYLRRLTPSDAATNVNGGAGSSVAVAGTLVVVGAPNTGPGGNVYGFDARTGKQLWKLDPVDAGRFGDAVALSGDRLLIGNPNAMDAGQSQGGRAYIYSTTITPPTLLHTLGRDADVAANSFFGGAVALCGNLAVVGRSGFVGVNGFTYLFDTESGARLQSWPGDTAMDGSQIAIDAGRVVVSDDASDNVRVYDAISGLEAGYSPIAIPAGDADGILSVAVSGNLALIGLAGAGVGGGAALFDLVDGVQLGRIVGPDTTFGDGYGSLVALSGNRALISAVADDDFGNNSGSVYFYRGLAGPMPLDTVAKKGDFAPSAVDADFASFQDAFLNDGSEAAFSSSLTNKTKGVFGEYAGTLGPLGAVNGDVSTLGGTYGAGQSIASAYSPIAEHAATAIFLATLKGTGITKTNNLAILQSNGTVLTSLFRTGNAPAALSGGVFQSFPEVVQQSALGKVAASYLLTKGVGGVTVGTDSGVFAVDTAGAVLTGFSTGSRHREGEPAPGAIGTYGQFLGRVAYSGPANYFYFPAYFVPTGEAVPVQALFYDNDTTGLFSRIATQGLDAPGPGAILIQTLVGETVQGIYGAYRATLSGDDTNAGTNEAIYSEQGFSALRKGQVPDPLEPAVTVSRFLGFWLLNSGQTVVVWANLRGPGVNASNDGALYLIKNAGTYIRELIREGDPVCGPDRPRLGTIQGIDVDTVNGNYAILASLTGNPPANQGLLTGRVDAGNDTTLSPLRRPVLKLRKGTAYQALYGESTTIQSLSLSPTTDRGGAGAKGRGQVINNQAEVIVTVGFTNRAQEVMAGRP